MGPALRRGRLRLQDGAPAVANADSGAGMARGAEGGGHLA